MRDGGRDIETTARVVVAFGCALLFVSLVVVDFATAADISTPALALPLSALLILLGEGVGSTDSDTDAEDPTLDSIKRQYAEGELTEAGLEAELESHFEREILDDPPESDPASEPMATGGLVVEPGTPEAVVPLGGFQKGPEWITAEEANRILEEASAEDENAEE